MGRYLKLYTGDVTKGEVNGTEISEGIDGQTALVFTLNASKEESKAVKCALRCIPGYKTLGPTTIKAQAFQDGVYQDNTGNTDFFKFAVDAGYKDSSQVPTWSDTITINQDIGDTNTLFWVKASSSKDEEIKNDDSVAIYTSAVIMQGETPNSNTTPSTSSETNTDSGSTTTPSTPADTSSDTSSNMTSSTKTDDSAATTTTDTTGKTGTTTPNA